MRNSLETNNINIIEVLFFGSIIWHVENPFNDKTTEQNLSKILYNIYGCKTKSFKTGFILNNGMRFINNTSSFNMSCYNEIKPLSKLFGKKILENMNASDFKNLSEKVFNYINNDIRINKSYGELLNYIINNNNIENIIT